MLGIEDRYEAIDRILKKHGLEYPPGGFSIGPGWDRLVDGLITVLVNNNWDKDLHQVKEKFGGLRFYVGKVDRYQQWLIDEATKISHKTCEDCGKAGSLREGGWLVTLCDGCLQDRRKGRDSQGFRPETSNLESGAMGGGTGD